MDYGMFQRARQAVQDLQGSNENGHLDNRKVPKPLSQPLRAHALLACVAKE